MLYLCIKIVICYRYVYAYCIFSVCYVVEVMRTTTLDIDPFLALGITWFTAVGRCVLSWDVTKCCL